jgi:hypothetical protein
MQIAHDYVNINILVGFDLALLKIATAIAETQFTI